MKEDAKKPVKPAPRPTRPLDKDATATSKPASKPRPAAKPAASIKPAAPKPGVATSAKPGVERPAAKPLGAKPPVGGKPPVGAKPPAGDLDSFHGMRPGMVAQPAILAEHTVAEGQTLGDLALKYYKSAAREKWMKIYEANKALIGDDPGKIKAGMVLKIPKID